ncbi:MAG: FKBP-type peptidyl-prolyl cis-trans isomerase [Gammaproteobacteria bacterium]|jgi:FKBP-type peptidyl-prolyl cis-trans isomerase SlpA
MADVEQITIGPGSRVTMHFSLRFTDGYVADASEPGEPLTFVMGEGSMVQGLEMALYGLKAGDKQTVELDPLHAFGFADPENVYTMPRNEFAPELPVEVGTVMAFSTPSGQEIPGLIREVKDDDVLVDFNHPLAGHDVIFEVEIVDIKPPAGASEGGA